MKKGLSADVAIVGAGIVGLAHAYMALRKGLQVVLFERDEIAVGASVRNFGLLWPIGQEPGAPLERAMRSRQHWKEVAAQAGFWLKENGSLHLAYHEDELAVLDEFTEQHGDTFNSKLLTPNEVAMKSMTVRTHRLQGGLFSNAECTVNPRQAVRQIPGWLAEKYGLIARFGHPVMSIEFPLVKTPTEEWKVDQVFVCSGSDFATLYPDVFEKAGLTKCKLQMMKGVVPEGSYDLGATLCAGLTLRHYRAFSKCPSLKHVDARYDKSHPAMKEYGIHVLLGQNNQHDLIIGDSHQYGKVVDPFDSEEINQLIIEYLKSFAELPGLQIIERWHGVYPKHPSDIDMVTSPEQGVQIINGLGGAGMTLSFGLAEEVIGKM